MDGYPSMKSGLISVGHKEPPDFQSILVPKIENHKQDFIMRWLYSERKKP